MREARRPAQKSESIGVVAEVTDEARAHGIAEVHKSVKRDLMQRQKRPVKAERDLLTLAYVCVSVSVSKET